MIPNKKYDVAIIGGGLAGLSLAIQCAAACRSVVLFEKENYPFHKVCGEYISLESWAFIERLGIPLSAWQLPIITQLITTDMKGKAYPFKLPLGGFGISRFLLDDELHKLALAKGVAIFTNTKATQVVYENDGFIIETTAGNFSAAVAAGSFGKRSNLDVKWNRPFVQKKPNKLNHYIGVKYHVQYTGKSDTISLHHFKNGYCGFSKIEKNTYCLCYLTTAINLKKNNNSISQMEQNILYKNPALKAIFTTAKFLYQQPLAISQISFEKKTQVQNHVLLLGDAAGMITPLCGNGMSMAMHSSKLAFEAMDCFFTQKINRQQMEQLYEKQWHHHFFKRLTIGRWVQQIFGGQTTTSLFLKTMKALPALASKLIRSTHGEPF